MNKKKYYRLLKEYQELVSMDTFNSDYSDTTRLSEIRGLLIAQIDRMRMVVCSDIATSSSKRDLYREDKLKQLNIKCSRLCDKIVCFEPIYVTDYQDTYIDTFLWLKKNVPLLFAVILILGCLIIR